jgi:uncharacterized protein
MKELIQRIVEAMIDKPEEMEIGELTAHTTTIIELKVAKQDFGKIIGKNGQNIKAIRDILYAASAKRKKRVILEVLE